MAPKTIEWFAIILSSSRVCSVHVSNVWFVIPIMLSDDQIKLTSHCISILSKAYSALTGVA